PKKDRYMKRMLLDRITAPQCPAAETRPRLIEGRLQASRTARLLEQPQLRGRRQLSEDHPQQPKFPTGVGCEPPAKQLGRPPGDRPRLPGRWADRPLTREGGEIGAPDLHPDAACHEPAGAQTARCQVREARQVAPQGTWCADILLEGLLGAQ